jgi:hypothetical protein
MLDRTSKILLAAIAIGLWANIGLPLLRSSPAEAQDAGVLRKIASDVGAISGGVCVNSKIC